MIIGTVKSKSTIDKMVKTRFALVPIPTSDGDWIWLENYYVFDDTISVFRGRCKDYTCKANFFYSRVENTKKKLRFWVDDTRPAPEGYYLALTTNSMIQMIREVRSPECRSYMEIEVIDLDHDAGDYANEGGDYIKILEWMEKEGINDIPVRFHSMNPVGVQNMRAIAEKNNWKILY